VLQRFRGELQILDSNRGESGGAGGGMGGGEPEPMPAGGGGGAAPRAQRKGGDLDDDIPF
jgi:single-strand DNA-binding protein